MENQKKKSKMTQGENPFSLPTVTEERWWHSTSLMALVAETHHPIWWKIMWWPPSRHTSERLDHTAQLGFLPPDFPAQPPGFTHPILYPFLIRMPSLRFSPAADSYASCTLTSQFSPGPPPLLTHGSVPSSAPAGVGCFPASGGSGWSRCHSLLSPDGQSTSHCCTSVDWIDKKKNRQKTSGLSWTFMNEDGEAFFYNVSLQMCAFD